VSEVAALPALDQYRAFVFRPERPLDPTGSGLLDGTTLAVKNNIDVAGMPTRAASPALPELPAEKDAPVVAALRAAGGLVAGHTNMHELAFGITSDNPWAGRVDNPVLPGHLAGGSSSGTAAAIAGGLADAGLGSDTGGSSRIPAAWCGIAGLRPTSGRYPGAGILQLSSTFDTAGPMAQTVAGVDRLDAALTGRSPVRAAALRGLRLGVCRPYFYEDIEPAVATAMEDSLSWLRDAGCELVERDLPGLQKLVDACRFTIVLPEVDAYWRTFARVELGISLAEFATTIASPDVRALFERLAARELPSEAEYRTALEQDRPQLRRLYADCFAEGGMAAFVAPCVPIAPPRVLGPGAYDFGGPLFETVTRNTVVASCAALPSLCLPVPVTTPVPVGLLLDGPHGEDERLLSIGMAIEQLAASP
jgi:Asp-tRNA(Asn)/Glu-tRNA(Gln) amidotransferase A subunit family amidase